MRSRLEQKAYVEGMRKASTQMLQLIEGGMHPDTAERRVRKSCDQLERALALRTETEFAKMQVP